MKKIYVAIASLVSLALISPSEASAFFIMRGGSRLMNPGVGAVGLGLLVGALGTAASARAVAQERRRKPLRELHIVDETGPARILEKSPRIKRARNRATAGLEIESTGSVRSGKNKSSKRGELRKSVSAVLHTSSVQKEGLHSQKPESRTDVPARTKRAHSPVQKRDRVESKRQRVENSRIANSAKKVIAGERMAADTRKRAKAPNALSESPKHIPNASSRPAAADDLDMREASRLMRGAARTPRDDSISDAPNYQEAN